MSQHDAPNLKRDSSTVTPFTVNTGEVSLLPAPGTGCGGKIVKRRPDVTEMLQALTWKWLEMPSDERIIAKATGKTQR
jgi:hypothetical protein